MKAFTYRSATSEAGAVKLLGPNARPLAGGTNLLNLMKERVVNPDVVVNLKAIKGLDRIDGGKIGANVRLAELIESGAIKKSYPALWQAADSVATPQIKNMATLGGNLCSRPPCWYFSTEGYSCPKLGTGKDCAAKEGNNEFHAVFATDGPCVAVHASSTAPALVALGARVRIVGPGGAREMPLETFFKLPSDDVKRENVLADNEIVTHVLLDGARPNSAFYEVRHKESHDWPVSIAAASLEMSGGRCKSARIVLGALAPIPWRVPAAEKTIAGEKVTEKSAAAAADAALRDAAPLAHNKYKLQTAKAAVKRAILMAATGKWR